jgi:hypothetical protein
MIDQFIKDIKTNLQDLIEASKGPSYEELFAHDL